MNIGRMEKLPLRTLWPHEARDFTTWIAENMDFLGETLDTIFDLPKYYDELGTAAKARLFEDFGKYGVDLTDFYVNSITPPDEVQEKFDERAAMGAVGDMNTYMQFKAAHAMMPGMIAGAMQQAQQGGGTPAAGAGGAAASSAAAGGFCTDCGAAVPQGAKFCPGCGTEQATSGCSGCGQPVPEGAKFCPNCGTQQGA